MVLLCNSWCCLSPSGQVCLSIWAGLAAMQMTADHDEVLTPLLSLFAPLPALS